MFILTGKPSVGKTTAMARTVDLLKQHGFGVGGMVSCEMRENGVRVGFEIQDLASGRRGWLAHVNGKSGPQVGKYRVSIGDLDKIGAEAVWQQQLTAQPSWQ
jgi:nucleoside-triphosphatase